jgi:hypothetical protein
MLGTPLHAITFFENNAQIYPARAIHGKAPAIIEIPDQHKLQARKKLDPPSIHKPLF